MSENTQIAKFSNELFTGIVQIIEQAKQKVAVVLNAETTLIYWNIGYYINEDLKVNNRLEYGAKIIATLSQQLTMHYGKGYIYHCPKFASTTQNLSPLTNLELAKSSLHPTFSISISDFAWYYPKSIK
jgi:hypothetical protein